MTKETGILIAFHTEETTNMDEKNRSTEELSLKCLVPGYKFGSFVKKLWYIQTCIEGKNTYK